LSIILFGGYSAVFVLADPYMIIFGAALILFTRVYLYRKMCVNREVDEALGIHINNSYPLISIISYTATAEAIYA